MSKIVDIHGREIIDSRGNPTVEADVMLDSGVRRPRRRAVRRLDRHARSGRAARRRQEALSRQGRDQGRRATSTASSARRCSARDAGRPGRRIDRTLIELDGTENKARLGANALLAVSLATAHAAARDSKQPLYRYLGGAGPKTLPVPMMNIINGGAHADNSVDIQEFMILPVGAPSLSRSAALRRGDLPHAQEGAARAQARDRGRRRRRLRAGPAVERSGARDDPRGDRPRRLQGRPADLPRPRRREHRVLHGRHVRPASPRSRKFTSAQFADYLAGLVGALPDRHDRGRHERGRLGRLGAADAAARQARAARRRRSVRHQHEDPEGRHRQEDRQCDPDQGQPDRHADRDAGRHRHGGATPATPRSSRIAPARPRTPRSPTSPSRRSATQIKTGSMSRSDRIAKYNQLLRIEAELGAEARYAGAEAFPVPLPGISC